MLVLPDGSQAGTLGGGCVEADVKRQALAVLERGEAEILTFTLDSDYGWDDGLICGGRMQVLVDPLAEPGAVEYYRKAAQLIDAGSGVTEAVVFDADKSGLVAASCYLFDEHGKVVSRLRSDNDADGGEVPEAVLQGLTPLGNFAPATAAGGIAWLPLVPQCRLLIVGGGHVGQALADLAADLAFDVWVVDDREQFTSRERFPKATRRICGPIAKTLRDMEITPTTYCVIVTRGHNHDEEALYHLADRGARYVGMIGSKRKIKLIFDDLLAEGVAVEALEKVYAPLGIHIGSQSVPEIAVSIAAELIAHRNRGGLVPGRPDSVPVTGTLE